MSNRILVIDYFRGIASLLVVLSHIREILFGVADLTNILYYPFYFITGLGHESVMIFFVISGFLVGGRLYLNKDNIKFKKYFINIGVF